MRLSIWFVTVIAISQSMHGQATVSGFLGLDNARFELNSVAAALVPDPFDKTHTKLRTRVLLTDAPVDPDTITEAAYTLDLKKKGIHGLELEISQDRSAYSLGVISNTIQQTLFTSGSFDARHLTMFTRQRVQAHIDSKPAQVAGVTFSYDVRFAVNVAPIEIPTAADAAAAQGKPSTVAYLGSHEAFLSLDKQRILEVLAPSRREALEKMDFSTAAQWLRALTPDRVEVLKATESGDRARLLVHGYSSSSKEPQRGVVRMILIDGRWYLDSESWNLQ